MKIIVDMMGGDNAPLAVLEGAAQAVKEYGVTVVGVGDEALVRKTAQENSIPLDGIELVNCTEVIDMCDEPARAIRQKKDSSIVVGLNMLKDGKGDAFVSAGSTGALHVGAKPDRAHPQRASSARLWLPWCPPKAGLSAAGLWCQCGVPPRDAGGVRCHGQLLCE